MEERALGPVVGLGTSRTFDADVELARRVVDATHEAGYRLYDTSPMYGSEEALGLALEPHRSESVVATKIWAGSLEEGRAQFDDQLRWFGRVEIEQVHNLVSWEAHLTWARGGARRRPDRPDRRHPLAGVVIPGAGPCAEDGPFLRAPGAVQPARAGVRP
jgi:hypothetical protein